MTRSAAAFLALMILPGIAQAQEQQRPATHDVVDGETLWALAQQYYDNPYLWPRIYEANRQVVEDPHWIYPGETLVIPDVMATVQDVAVVAPEEPAARPVAPTPAVATGDEERTVFWRGDERSGFIADEVQRNLPVVAREVFYSAPWLIPEGMEPPTVGRIGALVGAEEERRRTYFTYDRVQVLGDLRLPTGTQLQAYRTTRALDGVGTIAVPTGVLSITEGAEGGVVALVVDEFDRITPGDRLRPLPSYRVSPGVRPSDVAAGPEAEIIGFANPQGIQSVYDVAFIDRGASSDVAVGDEYILLWREDAAWPATVEGRLQVVAVEPTHASARIVGLRNPVFEPGSRVVLSRKMP